MRDILNRLNDEIRARASLVIARDGMLIATACNEGIDGDRLAALGAAVVTDLVEALAQEGFDEFTQIEVAAERGKVILVEAGPTYLLVLVGARLEVGPGSIEIRAAAQRVAREATLSAQ